MEIISRRQRMFSISRKLRREAKSVGFVPTMGSLHAGHLKLVEEARQRCDIVIVSIFVNPTQFDDSADLERYPRDLAADAAMLADFDVDYIFAPEPHEIYGDGFSTSVEVRGLTETLEGASRPGHFRGVATVVTILFNTLRPDFAFLGQKDAQQVAVIRRLVADLGFETEIVVVPTVRESSGLAMSSRNDLLSLEQRDKASIIITALREGKLAFKQGERNTANLARIVRKRLESEALSGVDYVAVVDRNTMRAVEKVTEQDVLLCAAVSFGNIRLIDNVILHEKQ
ncbi:MAG: pantoate--beta-alanine ligase [Pyrinomonadaceae bacterium]